MVYRGAATPKNQRMLIPFLKMDEFKVFSPVSRCIPVFWTVFRYTGISGFFTENLA